MLLDLTSQASTPSPFGKLERVREHELLCKKNILMGWITCCLPQFVLKENKLRNSLKKPH